jgi:hypothetical protein
MILALPGQARPADNTPVLPGWIVPVLKLVSATRVQPVTGVVISSSGLVAVPEGFATEKDEIIVLDGGTDIVRFGRPAQIVRHFSGAGITVISVSGLVRKPPGLSNRSLRDGEALTLHALPPAEMIAQGADPLAWPARLSLTESNANPAISAETPLPNVTGALVDKCGGLTAINLADGVQSLDTPLYTRLVWADKLVELTRALKTEMKFAVCGETDPEVSEPVVEVAEDDDIPHAPEPEPEPEPETVTAADPEPETEQMDEAAAPLPDEESDAELDPEPAPAEEPAQNADVDAVSANEVAEQKVHWWSVIITVLLLVAAWVSAMRKQRQLAKMNVNGYPDSLEAGQSETGSVTTTKPDANHNGGFVATTITLSVHGQLADGTRFSSSCLFDANEPQIMIGRGATDICIECESISREHASIGRGRAGLTLSDLGSRNGTRINGIPCQAGETFYFEADDEIELADVCLRIGVIADEGSAE